ncbi:hypothetical protein AGLY_002230 [Aphis glycines]|uniref:Uncharacterized protein n=1 Tax=Aphis glycines TaxID=307491 RepID=A0A6G0U3S6_APHGL|nr:hypothetical protein AGLY_002230 [Aphis glycines]
MVATATAGTYYVEIMHKRFPRRRRFKPKKKKNRLFPEEAIPYKMCYHESTQQIVPELDNNNYQLSFKISFPLKFTIHFNLPFCTASLRKKWVPLCCTLGGGVDLGLGIYDLYYLNNNKYQKSFQAKPLFNAVLKIYGEPCTKYSKLSYKRKIFYDFSTTKLLANFRNFDIFQQLIRNLVLNFQDFLVSQKIFIFLSYSKIKKSILTKTNFA